MIVDKIVPAIHEPLITGQTERITTTFRVKVVSALVGTLVAMTFTHATAETTDLPFVGVSVYNPTEDDFPYDYLDVDVSDPSKRIAEEIDNPVDPIIVDQFLFGESIPETENNEVRHTEYFLIDPGEYEIDLGLAKYTKDIEQDISQEELFFSLHYEYENADTVELYKKVSQILGTFGTDLVTAKYMDFQYNVETLNKLTAYSSELGLDNFTHLQQLAKRGKNDEVRSRIIEILSGQYPEITEESLIVTRYTEKPEENAPRITDDIQETGCIIESIGVTNLNLYGSVERNANYRFAFVAGALLGSLFGIRRKKVNRDPLHMDAPDVETVEKVTNGTADITDRVKVAFWKKHLSRTQVRPEVIRESKLKARKAGSALLLTCGIFSAVPSVIQAIINEKVPRDKINAENHTSQNNVEELEECQPGQLVYSRYIIPKNPDVKVILRDLNGFPAK